MTTQAFGRDQSYARKVNNELVIQKLRKEDLSATELSSTLNLSHAADRKSNTSELQSQR